MITVKIEPDYEYFEFEDESGYIPSYSEVEELYYSGKLGTYKKIGLTRKGRIKFIEGVLDVLSDVSLEKKFFPWDFFETSVYFSKDMTPEEMGSSWARKPLDN